MLRVAAWTGGLFAIGAGVAHFFPGSWTEPLVLAALGATMLLAGRRPAPAVNRAEQHRSSESYRRAAPGPRSEPAPRMPPRAVPRAAEPRASSAS